jgi:hypothetical protein
VEGEKAMPKRRRRHDSIDEDSLEHAKRLTVFKNLDVKGGNPLSNSITFFLMTKLLEIF